MTNRPHVMQCLMLQLCTVWRQAPTLATPFFIYFPSLLVYREPILDDHNRVDGAVDQADKVSAASVSANSTATIFTVTESSTVLGIDKFHHRHISRVLLLDFLETQHVCEEDAEEEEEFVTCMHHLIETLIAKNTNVAFQSPAMIGSELFGEKLRCWQALCVLSRHMTEALWRRVSDTCFASLTHPCAHGIRVHLEIFFAAMTSKFSHIILPQLLELLVVFNHSQQVGATISFSLAEQPYRLVACCVLSCITSPLPHERLASPLFSLIHTHSHSLCLCLCLSVSLLTVSMPVSVSAGAKLLLRHPGSPDAGPTHSLTHTFPLVPPSLRADGMGRPDHHRSAPLGDVFPWAAPRCGTATSLPSHSCLHTRHRHLHC